MGSIHRLHRFLLLISVHPRSSAVPYMLNAALSSGAPRQGRSWLRQDAAVQHAVLGVVARDERHVLRRLDRRDGGAVVHLLLRALTVLGAEQGVVDAVLVQRVELR